MSVVVVSQPMFLPWHGLFEQLRLADHVVHYDDVQLPLGRSFTTRVQVKTAQGARWLTAPVKRSAGQNIDEVRFDDADDWRRRHLETLRHAYGRATHGAAMLDLAERIYATPGDGLAEFNIAATERLASHLGIRCRFHRSSTMVNVDGALKSSERLIAIVEALGGDVYVTGHGAKRYLDHERFESRGIQVRYMAYERRPYAQLYGPFDPHVTVLDAIANLGGDAAAQLTSDSQPWRTFLGAAA